jgi:hypothetical protein
MVEEHEDEGSRSIHGRSDHTIAAEMGGTGETVEETVSTVCAAGWCYNPERVNRL